MSWGAAAVGGVLVGGYLQSQATGQAADAAQGAASATQRAAAANKADILALGTQNQNRAMSLASATPQELATLDQSYQAASTNLANQQKLVDSINPSIMEASKQALDLLRGGSAAVNNPLMAQRSVQRSSLVNQLREQYGPGAESSALGQKVLQSFDMDSNSMVATNNQNSLNQLYGIANTNTNSQINPAVSSLQQVGQGYSAIQDRQLNAQLNTGNALLSGLTGANQAVIQTAGAPFVGQAVSAAGQSSLAGNLMGAGTQLGMSALKSSGSPPPSTSSGFSQPMPTNASSTGYWATNPYS